MYFLVANAACFFFVLIICMIHLLIRNSSITINSKNPVEKTREIDPNYDSIRVCPIGLENNCGRYATTDMNIALSPRLEMYTKQPKHIFTNVSHARNRSGAILSITQFFQIFGGLV